MNVPENVVTTNGFAIRADRVSRHYKMAMRCPRCGPDFTRSARGEFLALLGASGSGKSHAAAESDRGT